MESGDRHPSLPPIFLLPLPGAEREMMGEIKAGWVIPTAHTLDQSRMQQMFIEHLQTNVL